MTGTPSRPGARCWVLPFGVATWEGWSEAPVTRRTPTAAATLLACLALVGCGDEDERPGPEVASSGVPRSFWGIVSGTELSEEEISNMGEANVGTLRHLLLWPEVEPLEDDAYDWSKLDALVTRAAESGIELLPFVYGTPAWALGDCLGYDPLKCQRIPPLRSDEVRGAWQDFLRDLVARYGPDGEFWDDDSDQYEPPYLPIRRWQIWNEPSSITYFRPEPAAEDYAELVRLSHDAITEVDPEAEILLGGLFGEPRAGARENVVWRYLERLYDEEGIEDYFDAVALHPYAPTIEEIEVQVDKVLRVMDEAGDPAARIWVSELGWGSAEPEPGAPLVKGIEGQKELLEESFALLRDNRERWRIDGVIWYQWKDLSEPFQGCTFCASAGLLDQGGSPKPSWKSFVEFTGGSS